jgi:hypothetical protein
MAVIGLALSIFGLGAVCWLMFSLAVYALPFCVGMTIALAALHGGAGIVVAFAVGATSAGIALVLGRIAFVSTGVPWIRVLIGMLYAVPAALAGYHLSLGLATLGMTGDGWREAFALGGAILIGITAFSRMTLVTPPRAGRGLGASAYSPFLLRQREQTKV